MLGHSAIGELALGEQHTDIGGSGSDALGPITNSASATVITAFAAALTLSSIISMSAGQAVVGAFDIAPLPNITCSGQTSVLVAGIGDPNFGDLISQSAAAVAVVGSADASVDPVSVAAMAPVTVSDVVGVAVDPIVGSGAISVYDGADLTSPIGELIPVAQAATLASIVSFATFDDFASIESTLAIVASTGHGQIGSVLSDAAGTVLVVGSGAPEFPPFTSSDDTRVLDASSLSVEFGPVTANSETGALVSAALSSLLEPVSGASAAVAPDAALIARPIGQITSLAPGHVITRAVGSVVLANFLAASQDTVASVASVTASVGKVTPSASVSAIVGARSEMVLAGFTTHAGAAGRVTGQVGALVGPIALSVIVGPRSAIAAQDTIGDISVVASTNVVSQVNGAVHVPSVVAFGEGAAVVSCSVSATLGNVFVEDRIFVFDREVMAADSIGAVTCDAPAAVAVSASASIVLNPVATNSASVVQDAAFVTAALGSVGVSSSYSVAVSSGAFIPIGLVIGRSGVRAIDNQIIAVVVDPVSLVARAYVFDRAVAVKIAGHAASSKRLRGSPWRSHI